MSPREHGSNDFDDEDDIRVLCGLIKQLVSRPTYQEASSERALLKWLMGLIASLLIVAIVGGVTLYGKVSAIEANQMSQQRQLDQVSATVGAIRRGP